MSKKYPIGRVYVIRSHQTDQIYIGSTCNTLSKRFYGHKKDYKSFLNKSKNYITSFELLKYDDAYIELIEEFIDLSKEQLFRHEGETIRKNNCVNKVVAGRTEKEYYEDTKEHMLEYQSQYRSENKEKISKRDKEYREKNDEVIKNNKNKKIACECGGSYTWCHQSLHFRSIKHLQFMNKTAEEIEEIVQRDRDYRDKHFESKKARDCEKITCDCGGSYLRGKKQVHLRTKKHQENINKK